MILQSKIQNPKPKITKLGSWSLVLGPWLLLAVTVFAPGTTLGAPSAARSQHTEVELISEVAAIAPGRAFTVALRMKMDPHWHTYWRNPGDSGLATTIQWTLPPGFTAGPILWPTPQRIEVGGLVSYAYEGEIFLLTEITPPAGLNPGDRVHLKARVDWLECEEICIPGNAVLDLALPVGGESAVRKDGRFDAARSRLPQPPPFSVQAQADSGGILLLIQPPDAPSVKSAWFFTTEEQTVEYGKPQTLERTPRGLALRIPRVEGTAAATLSGVLRLDSASGTSGYSIHAAIEDTASNPREREVPFIALIGLGFLGGLILNLMPCVFPVLGIKIMGLVRQGGEDRRGIARHGLAYTGGVLLSFWLLAGVLLALREGGAQLGWGFQLQHPAFVFSLAALLLLFGLNMSGVFEIGGSLVGAGAGATAKPGLAGSFFSGVLATVVATPCAAPFLAPALGAALTLPPLEAMVLFTAIALGMALPYLLLSFFPALTRALPRPGPWMESFKQALAFLLYAAAGYLLWVLVGQLSESRQLSAVLALVLLAMGAWVYGRWCPPIHAPRTRLLGGIVALALLGGGLAYGWPRQEAGSQTIHWEPWSAERIEALRKEGRPIYVDFTARWCATCQVNKRVVFGSSQVVRAFRERSVATLKADWTNQDPAITAELAKWGRSAVPFNLLYLPAQAEPIVLPEVLTPGIVLDALQAK